MGLVSKYYYPELILVEIVSKILNRYKEIFSDKEKVKISTKESQKRK